MPHPVWPIEWVFEFDEIIDYLKKIILEKSEGDDSDIFIGDFGAGRNEEIPLFFSNIFPSKLRDSEVQFNPNFTVYCTDLHTLRIEDLFSKLIEEEILETSRVVHAGLERMTESATFTSDQKEFIEGIENPTWIDEYILRKSAFPASCLDIGIMNNDMIGYLAEYYQEYSNLQKAIEGVREVMDRQRLLIVTQPCSLYKVDNIEILERNGFSFIMGADIDKRSGKVMFVNRETPLKMLGELNHYTFLTFITA